MFESIQTYQDSRGLHYVGMSESWKKLCLDIPDSERIQLPPTYKSA